MSVTSFFTGDSGSGSGSQTGFGSLVTDLGTLFATGYGAYQEVSSGAPARNPVPGATAGAFSSSSSSGTTKIFGFSVTTVLIAMLLLIALGVGIYYLAR